MITAAAALLVTSYILAASDDHQANHCPKALIHQPEGLSHHRCPHAGSQVAATSGFNTLLNDLLGFYVCVYVFLEVCVNDLNDRVLSDVLPLYYQYTFGLLHLPSLHNLK